MRLKISEGIQDPFRCSIHIGLVFCFNFASAEFLLLGCSRGQGLSVVTLGQIQLLNGWNYKTWRNQVEFYLSMHQNMDLCLIEEQPLELDTDSTEEDRKYYKEWYQCNRKAKNVIRSTMSNTVRGSIVEPDLAMDFLEAIADKYRESHKAEAARLSKRFNELKFSGSGSVREHIMELIEINARLRDMGMGVNDEQVVHVALFSLPSDYSNLRTSYNATESKWDLNKLISICVDEEDRVKKEKETTKAVNLVEKPKWKKHNKLKLKKTTNTKVSGKPADSKAAKPFKFKCYFCKKVGHMKKECSGFKAWMIKKGFNKQEGAKE